MSRVLFGMGGSDAVESALKLARQYWIIQGEPTRTKFISLKNSYHGVNFGGTSVGGIEAYKFNYGPMLDGCSQIEAPCTYRNPWLCENPEELTDLIVKQLEQEILDSGPESVAAFIAEPVQGAGGVIVPPEEFWTKVRGVCDKYGILLIADEVVTGFGRSGSMFGSRGWGVKPDIMTLAKALTAGYVPLSATLFNDRIADAFLENKDHRGLNMTGYTYSAHPLGCAAALAVLDIVEKENLAQNAAVMGEYLLSQLKEFEEHFPSVGEVRGKGLMLGIDLVKNKQTREPIEPTDPLAMRLAEATRDAGVIVRPAGPMIILAPPLIFTKTECDLLVNALKSAFETVDK